ncbi:MAG: DNA-formamidopyrimidine glycosylase [Bacilli bacterium]
MPELPEVETVKNTLLKFLVGKSITDVEIKYGKIIRDIDLDVFKKKVTNQKINDIKRIGKYLIFILDDYVLISHLRMEGKYFYRRECFIDKHDHICFKLDNNMCLIYNDTRKFGTMNLEAISNYNEVDYLKKLGYEPFDEKLNAEYLFDKLHKKSIAIKTALLDQTVISGLGNIYVDEVLFLSKILPTRKCCELVMDDFDKIANASKIVIKKAIEEGGTTIKTFSASEGVHGKFQNSLNVHTKKKCGFCSNEVIKVKINGRGTYYCKNCQE